MKCRSVRALTARIAEKLRLKAATFCTVGDRPGLKQDKGRNLYAEGSVIQGSVGKKWWRAGRRGRPC